MSPEFSLPTVVNGIEVLLFCLWELGADGCRVTGLLLFVLALTCGELVYGVTPSSERRAIAAHRFNRVVVSRPWRKVHHRHAVDHVREILIPSVERFCPATEVLGACAIVHHRVLDRAAASIGRPSDNSGIIRRRFQCR